MAGEYIQADNNADYWKSLKAYYMTDSPYFEEIDKAKYDSFARSEREDSDNHYNQNRLGEDTKSVDVAFYKYLPEGKIAYRIHIVDEAGKQDDHYFIIKSFS